MGCRSAKEAEFRRWLRGTTSCAALGDVERAKVEVRDASRESTYAGSTEGTIDIRKIQIYYVASCEMDRLVQLRVGDDMELNTKFSSRTGCCFA